jgi:hypothetical protein
MRTGKNKKTERPKEESEMSLEWYFRMEKDLRNQLPALTEPFGDEEILFDTNTTEHHPSFLFSVETEDGLENFCVINYDPVNQEFYSFHYHEDADLEAKVLFHDMEEMVQFIQDSLYEHLWDRDDDEQEDEDFDGAADREDTNGEFAGFEGDPEEEAIEWISNDKHLHIEERSADGRQKYAIHLKMGIDKETGDGVLYRNTYIEDEDEPEEKLLFYFKEEEAEYLRDLFSDYLSHMEGPEEQPR